jgi:transcription elongation factor Elf1
MSRELRLGQTIYYVEKQYLYGTCRCEKCGDEHKALVLESNWQVKQDRVTGKQILSQSGLVYETEDGSLVEASDAFAKQVDARVQCAILNAKEEEPCPQP